MVVLHATGVVEFQSATTRILYEPAGVAAGTVKLPLLVPSTKAAEVNMRSAGSANTPSAFQSTKSERPGSDVADIAKVTLSPG